MEKEPTIPDPDSGEDEPEERRESAEYKEVPIIINSVQILEALDSKIIAGESLNRISSEYKSFLEDNRESFTEELPQRIEDWLENLRFKKTAVKRFKKQWKEDPQVTIESLGKNTIGWNLKVNKETPHNVSPYCVIFYLPDDSDTFAETTKRGIYYSNSIFGAVRDNLEQNEKKAVTLHEMTHARFEGLVREKWINYEDVTDFINRIIVEKIRVPDFIAEDTIKKTVISVEERIKDELLAGMLNHSRFVRRYQSQYAAEEKLITQMFGGKIQEPEILRKTRFNFRSALFFIGRTEKIIKIWEEEIQGDETLTDFSAIISSIRKLMDEGKSLAEFLNRQIDEGSISDKNLSKAVFTLVVVPLKNFRLIYEIINRTLEKQNRFFEIVE